MSIEPDDEILQDFLVEAGEILDSLGEQLVELEQTPNNLELLNSIFRGFHTVKGGAGFLAIEPLVEICHSAEDVFNILRQGDRQVTADLMDVILRVLDVVNDMFTLIRQGDAPNAVDKQLLERLQSFACAETQAIKDAPAKGIEPNQTVLEQTFSEMLVDDVPLAPGGSVSGNDDITEEEFEALLDALQGNTTSKASPTKPLEIGLQASPNNDEISEDEFEQLLDTLHGNGKFSAENLVVEQPANSGDITEQEFDRILDDLHGRGKFDASAIVSKDTFTSDDNKAQHIPKVERLEPVIVQSVPAKSAAVDNNQFIEANTEKLTKTPNVQTAQADTTVRVDTQVLDDIMNMVGELVLVRNRFQTLKASTEASEQLTKAISNLDVVTADLQLAVMKTRMQPIKKVFGRFPRVVRDLARSLKKEIRLDLIGEDTDLDKNLVEALADPLVHLVRNAVDHGIEKPEEREALGKPREGVVVLKASQEGDHIQLSIKDDGKGMDPELLRLKVVEKGLMDEENAARLDDKECFNLIFLPGFSTKNEISDVSGRGVGMDVVKTRISQMNGVVEIDSVLGKGSTIIIKVPLTLAIMPTLMVKLSGQAFALPLASVLEILDLDLTKTNKVDGQLVAMVRNKALPLFYLSQWLVKDAYYASGKPVDGHVVVVNAGGRQVGFVVDQLIGQEEVVIKALGAKLHGLEGLSGATITGDGKIALILDVPGLIKKYAN